MSLKSWLWFIINYLFNYTSYNKNWIAETVEKYLIFCCEVKTLVSFRVKCLWVIWSPIELICYRVRTGKIRCVAMKMKKHRLESNSSCQLSKASPDLGVAAATHGDPHPRLLLLQNSSASPGSWDILSCWAFLRHLGRIHGLTAASCFYYSSEGERERVMKTRGLT